MNRYGKRCVLYPRVSTEMQVDGYSLEGQKNMLTRFADREEMIVVDTYEDAGKSGKSIEGRPAFQKMLRDIEDGLDIDYILVYKLSRFGRNAADILNSLELVQSYGVNLICIEEGIDSSQTSGKLLISVLSAVAEIERENIIEQTMNGRREKARQGGWNGGFAPYGYTLEDNKLMIEETEAVAIRKIFELYTSSEIGLGGIANQLNLQGIRKIPRQNGTLEDWTGHFIKLILDNPVYCGKIAYGRRTKEKVKGTKNDYQMKRNDDYILTEGQHKGIVSEEIWEKAHAKRLRTGVKQPSKIGRDRVHLLSGLLKCPVCGSPMYTNKHAWTNKDGTYKEIYYYVCSRNRMVRGKHCEYKAMLKKTDIEPMVIEAIREIVRNEEYAQAIKKRICVQIDTKAVDKELEGYQAKLKEVDLNKTRLEREIDSLPADAKYRERKLHDMTLRLDSLYDVIVELEEKIEDARLRRDAIKQQAITLENIYKIMVNFDCVYNIINDEEKRNVVTALIKEIEIYRNDESEYPLKRIGLNFPVFKDGGEVTELLWDKGNTVETLDKLLQTLLYEFPIREIAVQMPAWVTMLESGHWLQSAVYTSMLDFAASVHRMADLAGKRPQLGCEYITAASLTGMDLASGSVSITAAVAPDIFYKILGEQTGLDIVDEASLLPCVVSLARAKRAYDKIKSALDQVEATGYGIVMPGIDELTLEEPEIVRQGGQYGVRLSASAPSLHIMRANIHTELSPTVGSEQQGEELIKSLLADFETDPGKLWSTNIFGKSLNELVSEGVQAKLLHMPQEARSRLQQTLERIINEGCDGLICILL